MVSLFSLEEEPTTFVAGVELRNAFAFLLLAISSSESFEIGSTWSSSFKLIVVKVEGVSIEVWESEAELGRELPNP